MVEGLASLLDLPTEAAAPRLWLQPGALDQVRAAAPPGRPMQALAPGANAVGKRWPAERYAELAIRMLGPGGAMAGGLAVVLGAEGEEAQARPILDALPPDRAIDLVGRTDPLAAGAWLARADLYIGNDSGLTHLAAAAGAPTLALFGPGLPARYRPWGPRAAYLIATDDPDRALDLCKIDDGLALDEMKKLSVAQVLAAAQSLYRRMEAA
jgi:lipopolysaccharide export system permease protein